LPTPAAIAPGSFVFAIPLEAPALGRLSFGRRDAGLDRAATARIVLAKTPLPAFVAWINFGPLLLFAPVRGASLQASWPDFSGVRPSVSPAAPPSAT
jgi:hypothetical protein